MPHETLVESLFAGCKVRLQQYAESLTHDSDRADDLVQEAFIQANLHTDLLSRLTDYQRRSWLYTVVKNRFIDQLRAARRRQELLQNLANVVASEQPTTVYAGEVNVFERLPGRFRDLLVQRYVLGMTSAEIALKLGVPAATVRSRIRLAIDWLRSHPDEWN